MAATPMAGEYIERPCYDGGASKPHVQREMRRDVLRGKEVDAARDKQGHGPFESLNGIHNDLCWYEGKNGLTGQECTGVYRGYALEWLAELWKTIGGKGRVAGPGVLSPAYSLFQAVAPCRAGRAAFRQTRRNLSRSKGFVKVKSARK